MTKNPAPETHTVPCDGGFGGCTGSAEAPKHIRFAHCPSCSAKADALAAGRKAAGAAGAARQARDAAKFERFIADHDA